MSKSKTDILAGLACIVAALAFYIQGINLSPEANLYPKVLEVFIVGMGVFLIIRGGLTLKTASEVEEVDFDKIKGIVIVIASVVYIAAINYVGFYVSSFIFLALCSWYLSQKSLDIGSGIKIIGISVGFSVILTVLLYILFTAILKVPTPKGILF